MTRHVPYPFYTCDRCNTHTEETEPEKVPPMWRSIRTNYTKDMQKQETVYHLCQGCSYRFSWFLNKEEIQKE